MVSDDKAEEKSISHKRAEVLMTLTNSRGKAKLESGSDPYPEVILTFPTRLGSSENMGVRALINMCAIGMLMKKSLFDSLKHETVDEPKSKTWTAYAGMFVNKKNALISGCLLPSIKSKCSFNMEVNAMLDSNLPYAVILKRDLMHQ